MGLAPSENPENLGNSVVAKVPVPIFHSLGAKSAKPAGRRSGIVAHAAPRRSAVEANGESEKLAASPLRLSPLPPFRAPILVSTSPLTRLPVLPSSMHKPWVRSEGYRISGLNIVYGWTASPVHSSSTSFCVRFNAPVARLAATLDTGPVASSYPRGIPTRLSTNHFQSARSSLGSPLIYRDAGQPPKHWVG
jgi:hypothetical protein